MQPKGNKRTVSINQMRSSVDTVRTENSRHSEVMPAYKPLPERESAQSALSNTPEGRKIQMLKTKDDWGSTDTAKVVNDNDMATIMDPKQAMDENEHRELVQKMVRDKDSDKKTFEQLINKRIFRIRVLYAIIGLLAASIVTCFTLYSVL